MKPTSAHQKAALAAIVAGMAVAILIYTHPEKLHAPPWVAYACAISFVFAGLSIGARGLGHGRAADWFVCLLLTAMTAVPAWIALGAGRHACMMTGMGTRFISTESSCRTAFGFAALILGIMLAMAVRSLLRRRVVP